MFLTPAGRSILLESSARRVSPVSHVPLGDVQLGSLKELVPILDKRGNDGFVSEEGGTPLQTGESRGVSPVWGILFGLLVLESEYLLGTGRDWGQSSHGAVHVVSAATAL